MILLTGCSYVNDPDCHVTGFGAEIQDPNRNKILARSGAGNYYIAQSIYSHLTANTDEVFVLWSGLSRMDFAWPASQALHFQGYDHGNREPGEFWIHTGGWGGLWSTNHDGLPSWARRMIETLYHPQDWRFINRQSLLQVVACLCFLEQSGVPYRWGWIYDIHQDYSQNASLGPPMDPAEPLLAMLPAHTRLPSTPFEFCRDRGLLKSDGFHPSRQGWSVWFDSLGDFRPHR